MRRKVLPAFVAAMDKAAAGHPQHFTPMCNWVLSLDQATIHTGQGAHLDELGLVEGENLIFNPARSGGLHQVIEHVHAHMMTWYDELLRQNPGPHTIEEHKRMFRDLFFQKVTPGSILDDCNRAKKYYKAVAASGGWRGPHDQW